MSENYTTEDKLADIVIDAIKTEISKINEGDWDAATKLMDRIKELPEGVATSLAVDLTEAVRDKTTSIILRR